MRKWMRWILVILGLGILFSVLFIIFNFVFLDLIIDFWWFQSLNLKAYFILRMTYRYLIFSGILVLFFLIFFSNFWFASHFLGLSTRAQDFAGDIEGRRKREKLFHMFQSGSMKIYTPLSILLAIPIAVPFYEKWEDGLLWFFSPQSGIQDPAFGKDISYFLFSLPVYHFIQMELLIIFSLLFLALMLMYYLEAHYLNKEDQTLPKGAKAHLTLIAVIVIIIQTWGFSIQRFGLVYTDSHLPRFFGPGFVEMWIDLPLIWTVMVLFVLTSVMFIVYFHKKKGLPVALGLLALFAVMVGFQNTDFVSGLIQEYFVKPNESTRERPYIQNSIDATLDAYNLKEITIKDYKYQDMTNFTLNPALQQTLSNIPVWDSDLLDDVYNQLQSFRNYYRFKNVDVGRYSVADGYHQVYLSPRELSLEDLDPSNKNWLNMHLKYTHGYGVVMTPASQGGDEPYTWFIRDIPIESVPGLPVKQPRIYYGEAAYDYVIAPNDMGEFDYGKQDKEIINNYEGTGGVAFSSVLPLSSLLKKIMFSVYFKERDILFTTKTNSKSRILFRRNIIEAISRVTPFFLLDNDPYTVLTSDGLYWIVDAYTASSHYPNAQTFDPGIRFRDMGDMAGKNYIRNSVKIVVDAYNGDIQYFIADPDDPIIRAYSRMYPGLLKDMDEMSEELKTHIRYPELLFTIQMDIYAKYHQTQPDVFYLGEDNWDFARSGLGSGTIRPYHLTLNLPGMEGPEFMLVCPMSPESRDNLRSLAIVGCDPAHYGQITIYSFPRGRQIFGPSQINAIVNQDTEIAQEITLWDQAGSEVRFGRMLILPIDNSLIYIQPVYIRSAHRLKIPELKRIIVSQGDITVMDRTIEEGLIKLEARVKERAERIRRRLSIPGVLTDEAKAGEGGDAHDTGPEEEPPAHGGGQND